MTLKKITYVFSFVHALTLHVHTTHALGFFDNEYFFAKQL